MKPRTKPMRYRRAPRTSAELEARLLVSARSRGLCEMRLPGVCSGRAVDWCHRIARGRGGRWTASDGLAGCRQCHLATTNTAGMRAEYERLGYIVRTGADTTRVPVWIAGRWWLLDDEGSLTELIESEAS